MTLSFKQASRVFISAGITGLFLYLLFGEQGADRLVDILHNISTTGVGLYVALSLAGLVLRTLRSSVLLKNVVGNARCPSQFKLLVVTAIRNAMVDLLPARLGELAYVYTLNRIGVSLPTAVSVFGFALALDFIVLFLLILALLILSPLMLGQGFEAFGSVADRKYLLMVILTIISGAMIAALRYLPLFLRYLSAVLHRAVPALKRLPGLSSVAVWIETNVSKIAADIATIETSGSLTTLALLTLALRLAKYGSLYVLLLAVVGQWSITAAALPFGLTTVAFVLAEASASLPISGIMGFGAYESTWSLIFSISKVEIPLKEVAFVVHLITQVTGYTVGILGMIWFLIYELRPSSQQETNSPVLS